MKHYRVIIKGIFSLDKIKINYQREKTPLTREMCDYIEKAWIRVKSQTPSVYNGKLFQVRSYKVLRSQLYLELGDTTYKEFVGTRSEAFIKNFGRGMIANPLTLGSLVITSDKKIVLGKRSERVDLEKNKYAIVGGYFDRDEDILKGCPDLKFSLQRELNEELGALSHEVKRLTCMGLVYNKRYNQTFMPFFSQLAVSSDELSHRARKKVEFSNLVFVDVSKSSIRKLLQNSKMFSDITLPTLIIFHHLFNTLEPRL